MQIEQENSLGYNPRERSRLPQLHWNVSTIYTFSLLAYAEQIISNFVHVIAARGDGSRTSVSQGSMSMETEANTEDNPNRRRGMVLPFEPLSITFDNIRYSVDMPQVDSNFNY